MFSTVVINISDPCHSVQIVIKDQETFSLIVRGEYAIICGIEINKVSHCCFLKY